MRRLLGFAVPKLVAWLGSGDWGGNLLHLIFASLLEMCKGASQGYASVLILPSNGREGLVCNMAGHEPPHAAVRGWGLGCVLGK